MEGKTYEPKTYQPTSSGQIGRGTGSTLAPSEDVVDYLKAYARQQPEKAALWCLGVGFVLGWKLKPW